MNCQTEIPHVANAAGQKPTATAQRPGSVLGVKLKTGDDRPVSPLDPGFPLLGRLRARGAREVGCSNWTIGCEVLDRDFANFWEYCEFVEPLGIQTVRLQAGWAKCEKVPGAFDFKWLDDIVDYLRAKGLDIILETSYGNPVHEGAGGWDLSGGIPSTDNGLAAWDRWIDALSKHFAGRVRVWAMWNEPDNNRSVNTPGKVAAFNRRTALGIRKNIPDARLQGLSLGGNDPEYFEACLQALAATGDVDLFETYVYHGYELAPERSYPMVEAKKSILAKYSSKARLRQGENGCPSEMIDFFALWRNPWSEFSQAKWNMRRMLGDFAHGIESSVYTMSDFSHNGAEIHSPNNKGLIRANSNRETIAVKRAYYSVQNVAGVFDATVERDLSGRAACTDSTVSLLPCVKTLPDGRVSPLFAFWTHGHVARKDDWTQVTTADLVLDRPGDSFETRPIVFEWSGPPLRDPVWVDLLAGRVWSFPKENQLVHSAGVTFVGIPVYDSPCLLAERAAISI
ncbi:MAG: beta-galactosidase [Kiritimatiellae bacterium]|nr:beta-galactosidase [Kiritimatiellia bacterium]